MKKKYIFFIITGSIMVVSVIVLINVLIGLSEKMSLSVVREKPTLNSAQRIESKGNAIKENQIYEETETEPPMKKGAPLLY